MATLPLWRRAPLHALLKLLFGAAGPSSNNSGTLYFAEPQEFSVGPHAVPLLSCSHLAGTCAHNQAHMHTKSAHARTRTHYSYTHARTRTHTTYSVTRAHYLCTCTHVHNLHTLHAHRLMDRYTRTDTHTHLGAAEGALLGLEHCGQRCRGRPGLRHGYAVQRGCDGCAGVREQPAHGR